MDAATTEMPAVSGATLGIVNVETEVTFGPVGGVPVAVAVLTIFRAETSAEVVTCVEVQVSTAPAASVLSGQEAASEPETVMWVKAPLPVFVTK